MEMELERVRLAHHGAVRTSLLVTQATRVYVWGAVRAKYGGARRLQRPYWNGKC
jgi:hypothetical protein